MPKQRDDVLDVPSEEQGGRGCAATIAGISLLLLVPSLGIATIAPMAGASGSPSAVLTAYLLFLAPILLMGSAAAGVGCYRRYSRLRLFLTFMLFAPAAALYASMIGS